MRIAPPSLYYPPTRRSKTDNLKSSALVRKLIKNPNPFKKTKEAIQHTSSNSRNLMRTPSINSLILHFDGALRVLNGVGHPARPSPATPIEEKQLSEPERNVSARLMRVNHCGEVCAQALYLGQGLTSKDPHIKATMQQAAREETDHLLWCEARLTELNSRKSYLNPIFYTMSFISGAFSGLMGNRFNLGFVAATEEQVVKHLEQHLQRLPSEDKRSKAILEQMQLDEEQHRTNALSRGGIDFSKPFKSIMAAISKVMTRTTHWI
jgi:ubiquinone biosynthesis monooxygenase Coq7